MHLPLINPISYQSAVWCISAHTHSTDDNLFKMPHNLLINKRHQHHHCFLVRTSIGKKQKLVRVQRLILKSVERCQY